MYYIQYFDDEVNEEILDIPNTDLNVLWSDGRFARPANLHVYKQNNVKCKNITSITDVFAIIFQTTYTPYNMCDINVKYARDDDNVPYITVTTSGEDEDEKRPTNANRFIVYDEIIKMPINFKLTPTGFDFLPEDVSVTAKDGVLTIGIMPKAIAVNRSPVNIPVH